MTVEARRTIAFIVVLLLGGGGLAALRSGVTEPEPEPETAVAVSTDPAPIAASFPQVEAPTQEARAVADVAADAPAADVVVEDAVVEDAVVDEPPVAATPPVEAVAAPVAEASAEQNPAVETPAVAPVADAAPAAETAEAALAPAPVVEEPRADAPTDVPAEETAAEETAAEDTRLAAVDPAATAPAPPSAPVSTPAPDAVFDIIRVEPDGSAVIAGRAGPGETVELLRNGERHDVIVADASGAFAFVPPPLPPGSHEIVLRVVGNDGSERRSPQSVTVAVDESLTRTPMVALAAPDAPTRILSQPEPEPAPEPEVVAEQATAEQTTAEQPAVEETRIARADPAAPIESAREGIRIATVEAETGGGLYVSAEGAPTASVRLYLNETLVARASADEAGDVSFAIRRGVRPGLYRVRLDDVDPGDGEVLSRAEVTFEMPSLVAEVGPEPAPEPVEAAAVEEPIAEETVAETTVAENTVAETPAVETPVVETPVVDAAPTVPATAEPALAGAVAAAAPEAPVIETTIAAVEPEPVAPAADDAARDATVVVPEVDTALVARGDSLWRISRRVYGAGIRYTVIFDANQEQIRNPNLIYPGQIFVLPVPPPETDAAGGTTR